MARIRTLDFLPEVFRTPTNAEFLAASLDQIVNPPVTTRIQGYVGSKVGYGINAKDYYVTEPTKTRADYQLEPSIVFTKPNESVAQDFISYPGIIDALKIAGGTTDNNDRMFKSQFYSWDSFTNLDKLVNFSEYYWLPSGPPAVTVSTNTVYSVADYNVTDQITTYSIVDSELSGTNNNPSLVLLRGGTYTFNVDQPSQFWIQTETGVSGTQRNHPNIPTREVYGVENNGASQGVVTFRVPLKDAQNEYIFPENIPVDLVSTKPFSQVNGVSLSELKDIDGVTDLEGKRVIFYDNGVPNENGYVSSYYSETGWDENNPILQPFIDKLITLGIASATHSASPYQGSYDWLTLASGQTTDDFVINQTIIFNGTIGGLIAGRVYYITKILSSTEFVVSDQVDGYPVELVNSTDVTNAITGFGLYEEGFFTKVSEHYYRITYVGNPDNPEIRLIPDGILPIQQNITPIYGAQWNSRPFYRNINGEINLVPQITAPLDVLYYQDGSSPNKVGRIRLIDSNSLNDIDVEEDILGKKNYISPNGVTFTNGLKVSFDGNVYPERYRSGEYYVEGVGTAIQLISADALTVPEKFTEGEYLPWDKEAFDIGNYDIELFIPVLPDYITIARDSISRNAWSRSNRWFHIDVINATAQYNNNPSLAKELATGENKAKRPIIEFYPNLKLFNSGVYGSMPVDFFDNRAIDALSNVAGLKAYYPDVETYTGYSATVNSTVTSSINVSEFIVGETYAIDTIGFGTNWNSIAGTEGQTFVVGQKIKCVNPGTGTGKGILVASSTTVEIPENDITGAFQIGMYVGDTDALLPTNAYITDITGEGTGTLTLEVSWPHPQNIMTTSNTACVVGTDTTTNNYAVYPGSRIIFGADADPAVANKIFIVDIETTVTGQAPVITLSLAEDGTVGQDQQVAVNRGYNYQGKSFYYTGSEWIPAQQKVTVNQAPLFDVFDENGISFSDPDVYTGTSFAGCKLFAYGINELTVDDPILSFPIRYSSIDNVGDISFDVSLNLDTFSYVRGTDPVVQNVNTGYVYNYSTPNSYDRQLGWVTAVAPSTQYQVFNFNYTANVTTNSFICDVAKLPDPDENTVGWPTIQVYNNNEYLDPSEYTVYVTQSETIVVLNTAPEVDTVIQIMVLSDQVSKIGYYQVPLNLNNNPLNQPLTTANIGDIRMQYRDIFINAPGTTGSIFGSNNVRDLGNLIPYGTKIIQNSASLALPGSFLRKQEHDLFNALLFNSREYVKFKQLLVDTVNSLDLVQRFTPSQIVDIALDQISSVKTQGNAFFWSDMVPAKAAYITNTYTFANSLDTSIYPLSRVYNFDTANYNGVLVYLLRTENNSVVETQLLSGKDYIVSTDSPSLTVVLDFLPGDKIVIKEYNQTYGSCVPNTPTKLGLYPAHEPKVVYDADYYTPTYFILGHDGSYTKLYGDYDPQLGILVDFRDQALLEFEKRIFNNLKLSTEVPIKVYDILPGFFRDSDYTWDEWLAMYTPNFLDWVGQNRVDYKTQFYNKNNQYTYNYTNSGNKLNQAPIEQGYWRGVYQYFYDTFTPNTTPWEMLGFSTEPNWWTERYGPAPYTSDNKILWDDLEAGLIWNNGNVIVVTELARPGLSKIIPVDSSGNLVSPLLTIVGNYNPSTFQKDWKIGDIGPVELSYRRSSTWPFDLVRLFALTRPAEFYNLAIDLDKYRYNEEFNQYLVNDRHHLIPSEIEVYGNGIAKTSYLNWIVDYEKQIGVDATANITSLLNNLDVRLVYRLAGYSDKTLLKFYVEKGSPNSSNASLLIPDESYQILLYDNQPFDKVMYSSLIVQSASGGWTVHGNSQTFSYFTIKEPIFNGKWNNIETAGISVKIATDYSDSDVLVPYGTKFYTIQEVCQFIASYAAWTKSKGFINEEIEYGQEINWDLMNREFIYWTQTGWEEGSVITLNPSASVMKVDRENAVVQPLTVQQQNFILNQNLYPIQLNNICVNREGTSFRVHTLNQGDAFAYTQFNVSNFEHCIVFDNTTLFNDVIYNLVTGLRQTRISVRGTKTAEWNGTVNASGFILNQDNVTEWSREIKYTKGSIVKYKNKYWSALKIVEPALQFNELEWKEIDYQDIQKGLLPNAATRSYESTLFYDTNQANLEQDANLLGYSLIGYRPRNYLALADLTDTTQVNVYKNMIKDKGTFNAVNTFRGANLPQGGIDYNVYENWAIKSGDYGGVLNENFVEARLKQSQLTGNPSIVALTNGIYTPGANQEVPITGLFNYGRMPETPNVLSTVKSSTPNSLYSSAGYVNFNDVKMASYYYAGLPSAINKDGTYVPINSFYVRDYMWLANFKEKWGVYTWSPIAEVVQVRGNINNTATVTFSTPHNLQRLDPIAIVNFAPNVDGYYIVSDIVDINQVIINLETLSNNTSPLTGRGVGMKITSQRVATPADISDLNLLEAEFSKNTVWVDENTDGNWAVYRKSINYGLQDELTRPASEFETGYGVTYGSAVAYTEQAGQLVGDAGAGKVYRYSFNKLDNEYKEVEVKTGGVSFGSKIVHANNVYVIAEPTSAEPKVHIYVINNSRISTAMFPYQEAIAAPAGVTNWGSEIAISNDANWIYVSDIDNNNVYVYRRQNINFKSGYFTVGETYTITNVGDTDFTALGAIENKVGITFIAIGSGNASETGAATQSTYKFANIISGSDLGIEAGAGFGSAISTNYAGDMVVIGAPNVDYDDTIINWGSAYVYQRITQNFESQYNSIPYEPQVFDLVWTPTTVTKTVDSIDGTTNRITLSNVSGLSVNDPVIFTGSSFPNSNLALSNKVYYINTISGSTITVKESRNSTTNVDLDSYSPTPIVATSIVRGTTYKINTVGTTDWTLVGASSNTVGTVFVATNTASGTGTALLAMEAQVQTKQITVSVNGVVVDDSNYAVVGTKLYYVGTVNAGDIVNVSDSQFRNSQTFTSPYTNRLNIRFGYSTASDVQGSKILVGSPYEIDENNTEGAVYSYINGGSRYGVVVGTNECNVTTNRTLQLNGYSVELSAGNAQHIANIINGSNITNIQASAIDNNKLIIEVVNKDIALVNEKLSVGADIDTLAELGISLFTNTQVIKNPHASEPSQFGKSVKINSRGSVLVSAPVGTRYEGTTFDFIDDENLDNDTVFDNNATRFVDESPNAGAVYMFDFLGQYNESTSNPGKYIYAQAVNFLDQEYGDNPEYGYALEFTDNFVLVGAPNFRSTPIGGLVTVFYNNAGVNDWTLLRYPAPVVDIEKIQNAQIFSASTNNTLVNLDYIDPLQGKLLGVVRSNIDYVAGVDPAKYNSDRAEQTGYFWGADQVGQIWFNTNNLRFMNYHQNDTVYNANYWGVLFPGSDVAMYTWVASNVIPSSYQGPGTPYNANLYCVGSSVNASGVVVPVYYFWVRNTNVVSERLGKTLSDYTMANYIVNPRASGIAYMAPVLPNAFALYNSSGYINANDSVLHVGYATGTSGDVAHQEFTLIRENFPDDFLPGIPTTTILHASESDLTGVSKRFSTPYGLYNKLLDSLSGCDEAGEVVPNPWLPKAVQSGTLSRPRQSFFYNRYEAIKNYLIYANDVLIQYPIAEIRPNATFLFNSGAYYDTTRYWEYTNWWEAGYDTNTKSTLQVPVYADLANVAVSINTLVTVEQNGDGKFEVYRYDGNGVWTRVGLENGTIQFKYYLWDYDAAKLGFAGDFFDSSAFDTYPSEETRNIVRALNEQIYIDELVEFRNKSLIILFEYIQSETTESQNYLPWLNKTSLIDVSHKVRELKPIEVFQSDNQEFLSGYINEVKPYHVVIKEFSFNYTGQDDYVGTFTDFDLPATFNSELQEYISPQLVYGEPNNQYEYSSTSDIWNTASYSEWYNNHLLSITGYPNYAITVLGSYLGTGSNYALVQNAGGFPVSGIITIGEEQISYSGVDKALNILTGLVRGVNQTTITDHIPGEQIFIDLPAVTVVDGGRNYSEPPRITAYIDTTKYPAPSVPAQLEPIMSGDRVMGVTLVPGTGIGYAVTPEIIIDPSEVIYFETDNINSQLHTINVQYANLKTGDIVKFKTGDSGKTVGKLLNNQWYYVNVLESVPSTIISLYTNYADAVQDHNRIAIYSVGENTRMSLESGAKASAITSASPIRENNINIRFDRTTYRSDVQDWELGAFYGSFFAGDYNNRQRIAASSIELSSTEPDINTILASAQGVAFEIANVRSETKTFWSSFIRKIASINNNAIRLIPQDGNNPDLSELEDNASGTTIGFYKNMPIKISGLGVGGLQNETIYYVHEVLSDIDFTVSETINGPMMILTDVTVGAQGLDCIVGSSPDIAVLTINYPGILNVTTASSGTNTLTVPLSPVGTGGTFGFYPNIPVFFTDITVDTPYGPEKTEDFGGIIENTPYYVTTVVDGQNFTVSKTKDPLTVSISTTTAVTNTVTLENTSGFGVNDQIIFIELSDSLVTAGLVQGATYYVAQVINSTKITISETINGPLVELNTATGTGYCVSQIDVVKLSDVTGSMTMNVSLPVSPGQVNGQQFTLYSTSGQYPNITNVSVSDLFERPLQATIATVNRIALSKLYGDTTFFYKNMPVIFDTSVGGIVEGQVYYVLEYSGMPDPLDENLTIPNIQVTVTNTSSSGNTLTCEDTTSLFVNMPIIFTGISLGGIVIDQQYYIDTIIDGTTFTIKDSLVAPTLVLTTSNGVMLGTGDPYIVVTTVMGDPNFIPTLDTVSLPDCTMRQFVETTPTLDISYILGGYRAIVADGGKGFAISNTITVPGTEVGGLTPANDVIMTVNTIDSEGAITSLICTGTVPGAKNEYYLKVISPNELEVYANPLLTIPVSGIDFPYSGYEVRTVVGTSSDNNGLNIGNTIGFNVYDAVVFTGNTDPEITGIVAENTYYVYEILSDSELTISSQPGNASTILTMLDSDEVNFTIAKLGDYAFLPEPFFFNQSVVRFNNRVYACIISNNDDEFILGKWQLLDSGDRRLNALDRTIGYYQPTADMPGVDVTQLFNGITYPNPIYYGNRFQPSEQFDLDTILTDLPFYPNGINLTAIAWDGRKYISCINLPTYTGIATSVDGNEWDIGKLTNAGIGATDIVYASGLYVMTSTNSATPVLRSQDGINWTTNGYYTPYGSIPYDQNPYDMTSLSISALALNSVTFYNNKWIAVGENIVTSPDTYIWNEITDFDPVYQRNLYGVSPVVAETFTGLIAVGKTKRKIYNPNENLIDSSLLLYSTNGINWVEVAPVVDRTLYGVASDGTTIIAIGDRGVRVCSTDGKTWFGMNEASVIAANSENSLIEISPSMLQLNQKVKFTNSFSGIVAGTEYFVKDIISSTLITISETEGGPVLSLVPGTVPDNTLLYSHEIAAPAMKDLVYAAGTWVAVGNEGAILTSTDGVVWEVQNSGTTQNLNGIIYNNESLSFIAVGEQNTIVVSEDNGVTWNSVSLFNVEPTIYDVQGSPFEYGYGPEELVPGNITDNMVMTVTTRPGTNWLVDEYGHSGFNVVSLEIAPTSETQTTYSFAGSVSAPAQLHVQVLDAVTGLGTTLAKSAYTVDWINKTITLNNPISFSPLMETLRIDVYEVGNGDQLVKSSTDNTPIRINSASGFNEIYVNCYYSQEIFQGSGVIRPGTYSTVVEVTATDGVTNRITCVDLSGIVVNSPISFQGVLFGGVAEETTYFVKTISYATKTITISDSYNPVTGNAGPTYPLTTATGSMYLNIAVGNGLVWADPIMYHNGTQLVMGTTGIVSKTSSVTNTITTSTTSGLIVNTPIKFCICIFGEVIQPMTTYYIKEIVDSNEFTISATPGGPTLSLDDSVGGSMFITNDYAFALQPNGIQTKIVFSEDSYTPEQDYIVFSLFGESLPEQYSYTLPQTQEFIGTGTKALFNLDNFVGDDNPTNAVVEINGLRQTQSQYLIDLTTNSILFYTPPAPGALISVTSYNGTRRQYLATQYGISGSADSAITALTVGSTTAMIGLFDQDTPVVQTFDQDTPTPVLYDEELYWLTLSSGNTSSLAIGSPIQFSEPTMGGIIAGRTYYVIELLNSTDFIISETIGGVPFQVSNDVGSMPAVVNGLTVAAISDIDNNISLPLATTSALSSTMGSPNEITVESTAGFAVDQEVQFYGTSFDESILTDGTIYYIDSFNDLSNTVVIRDYDGNIIETSGGTGEMTMTVGGVTGIRVSTYPTAPGFKPNTLVRMDGISGSTQLNGQTYYTKIIDPYTIELYTQPYDPNAEENYPVTSASSYTGGGYVWRAGLFYLACAVATATSSVTNRITVNSTANLVVGTPVYFNKVETVSGTEFTSGLVSGQTYYVKEIYSTNEFYVSETRNGEVLTLSDSTDVLTVSQWSQDNVDRLWVTVNGYRVPSSKLKITPANEISILTPVKSGDDVTITSMIPTPTPDEEVYMNIVDSAGRYSIYNQNAGTTTWLTQPLYELSTEIHVANIDDITRTLVQEVITPQVVDGYYEVGIIGNKNEYVNISVYNNNTSSIIDPENYSIIIIDLTPTVRIKAGSYITEGDSLTITIVQGDLLYVNGEFIGFGSVDLETNTLRNIQRGLNGTAKQYYIPTNTLVSSISSSQRLSDIYYGITWNSSVYNTVRGDPLQVSQTIPADFLKTDTN